MKDAYEELEEEIEEGRCEDRRRKKKSVVLSGIELKPWWNDAKKMILEGVPISEIARHLLSLKVETGYSEKGLMAILYRKAKELRMRIEIQRQRDEIDYSFKVYNKEYVEPEVAMQALGFIAFDRVLIDFQKEKDEGRTSAKNIQNIKAAKDIWESIARIKIESKKAQLPAINTNIHNNIFSNMQVVKEKFVERYGERVANVMVQPESRRKILDALECVRAIGQGPISEKIHQEDTVQN